MRIAICDEDQQQREELLRLIRTALAGESVSYQVREYACAKALLYDVEDGEGLDLVLVDVAMPHGWTAARQLRCLEFDGDIILVSCGGEHAVDGYALEADGYLLKPYDPVCVQELLTRLCTRVRKSCLTVSRHRHILRIPYHEIEYIESRNAKCVIHCTDAKEYVTYVHLDELEARLRDTRFLRCHQSYLVNMDHIVRADKQFEMEGGDTVSIRQRELHRIREQYWMYLQHSQV